MQKESTMKIVFGVIGLAVGLVIGVGSDRLYIKYTGDGEKGSSSQAKALGKNK